MTVAATERYVDEFGGTWELRAVLTSAGRQLLLVDPDGLGRILTPAASPLPRPVPEDEPLPVEFACPTR